MASRTRFWFVTVSVFAHVAAATAVFVAGVWHVERLDRDERPVAMISMNTPPPPPAGGAMNLPKAQIDRKPRRIADGIVQITKRPDEPPKAPAGGTEGEGTGTGTGIGDGSGSTPSACTIPPCPGDPVPTQPPQPPQPPVVEDPIIVAPSVLTMLRTRGETQVGAPPAVKAQMVKDNRQQVMGVLRVCVSEVGAVTSVKMLKSTGYPAYDDRLAEAARDWQYRPYAAKGRTVRICGVTTFVYSLR